MGVALVRKRGIETQTDQTDPHKITLSSGKHNSREWIFWLAAAILSIPLFIRGCIGTLTRYTSDDFCWSMLISEHGFLGVQIHLYMESYGRWAASALLSLMSYAGNFTAPLLPMVAIVLFTAALAWFVYEISQKLVLSILIAEIIVLAILTTTPRTAIEPLYWQSALLTYIPPFIIGPLGGALALRLRSTAIAGVTACLACGFNEAISVMVLCGLIAAIPFVDRRSSVGSDRRRFIFAAVVGAFLSTALAAVSPGNAIRRGDADLMPDPLFLVDSLRQTGELLWEIALSPAGILLFVMGMALAPNLGVSRRIRPLWIAAIGFLLAVSATATSIYGLQKLLARTAIVPTSSLVVTIFILGLWAGGKIVPRNALISLLCAILFVIATGSQSLSLLPVMQKYERSWEVQNKTLEEAGPGDHVTIEPSLTPFRNAWHLEEDPNWSINRCVAAYYGVASVRTAADPR